ncbi:hypothetical protein SAMN05443633_105255 [Chryseobacterium arachidis]|uniref:Response regulator receiver domain-containing protein n=1 Tax=Chryseobacterium arachidis TaxID=1416778 RepID=A0A1M5DDH8_9FLAO|nr:hypothetical protein [Chryseobacterium arachidis]SHF64976.1 hypothetical protein SAMN05443633_105255 [Chryseobacterium arachidis]
MNKEYLNVVLLDHHEDHRSLFQNVFKEIKINVKCLSFDDEESLMRYLKKKQNPIPEIAFLSYTVFNKDNSEVFLKIKSECKQDHLVTVIYSDSMSASQEELVFVKGANIAMELSDNYKDMKNKINEIMMIMWQYHTSGLNKNNFIMKV